MLIFLVSLGVYAQQDHSTHSADRDHSTHTSQEHKKIESPTFVNEKVGLAYLHYIHLKDALVSSDKDEAKKAATDLQKSLTAISTGKKAAAEASKIVSSSDITMQRQSFSHLSNEMSSLVKASKLSAGTLYVEYCPMANDNTGALWLSNEREIKNPYFGDMMLKCGSVKETVTF